MENEMVGKVCSCSHKNLGVITKAGFNLKMKQVFYGYRIDPATGKNTGRNWQSMSPTVISDSLDDYCKRLNVEQTVII